MSANQYLEQTVFTSDEARQAFQSGMLWAGLLANKCYQFGDIMISEEELTHYVNKIATERANK